MPGRRRVRALLLSSRLPPYLVLLRVGFTLPPPLLPERCALTAPFHPYRCGVSAAAAVCSLWHWPSTGLEARVPDVIRHTALRSSDFPPPKHAENAFRQRPPGPPASLQFTRTLPPAASSPQFASTKPPRTSILVSVVFASQSPTRLHHCRSHRANPPKEKP